MAAVILPRASTHHAATDHHGPRLNLMLSRASVTELCWRARPARDCTKTAAASRHMIRRQRELGPSRKAMTSFCVLVCEYAVIETDRDAAIVTLGPTSDENKIGNVECQSSDVAFALGHRMADSPAQM